MNQPKTIVIMTGSVRPNSVSQTLLPLVKQAVESTGAKVEIADLKEMNLPFFDGQSSPASDDFQIPHESVQNWSDKVTRADGIIMLTPEYNNQLSGVQKNAIDWLYKEWQDKPIAAICYGWGGGKLSGESLTRLVEKVGGKSVEPWAYLYFTRDIAIDGTVLNDATNEKISATVNAII